MEIANLTLLGAFILGLMHTLEPCEDKAVVSLYALWSSRKWWDGLMLVILYGLGMTLVDTGLGFVSAFVGVTLLRQLKEVLEIGAGGITVMFGIVMFTGKNPIHLVHHHGRMEAKNGSGMPQNIGKTGALLFGLIRGLPPCPFELAVLLWAASAGNILMGTLYVFVFGLGTTVGLIPLGFIMGGLAGAAKRTKYSLWIPKICGATITIVGAVLILASLLKVEL